MSPTLPSGAPEAILVVDDDDAARTAVERTLGRAGYRVLTAANPEAAMRAADEFVLDLLLVDVILPSMSGLTLAEDVHKRQPEVRILYMSGYTGEEVLRDQNVPTGVVDFLQKPFTVEELEQKVRGLLERGVATEG